MRNRSFFFRNSLQETINSEHDAYLDLTSKQFKTMIYSQYYESWIREDCANFKLQKLMHMSLEKGLSSFHFSKVLEIGARSLEHFNHVKHSFDTYLLTDIEKVSLTSTNLEDFDERLKFQVDDICKSKLPSETFDRVILTCVLHHVRDVESSLLHIRRTMQSGAIASILLPCDPGIVYRIGKHIGPYRRAKQGNYLYIKKLMDARDHVNHHIGIKSLIQHVFRRDLISERYYPFNLHFHDLNIWSVFTIKKR